MSEDRKGLGTTGDQQSQNYYGTFQGVANYYTPPPPPPPAEQVNRTVIGLPQPIPPTGSDAIPSYNPYAYQTATGYVCVHQGYPMLEVLPVRERRLPCCGIGVGWFLFLVGFFLGGIPWYIGTFLLLCARLDRREKPGFVACAIASLIIAIAVTLRVRHGPQHWPH